MTKSVIESEMPGAGKLSSGQLRAVLQKSCSVLHRLGSQIQWVARYVTDDKVYCVYVAPNGQRVRERAQQGGFPANRISEIRSIISPATAKRREVPREKFRLHPVRATREMPSCT